VRLLEVERLRVSFETPDGTLEAVGLAFHVDQGETLGVPCPNAGGKASSGARSPWSFRTHRPASILCTASAGRSLKRSERTAPCPAVPTSQERLEVLGRSVDESTGLVRELVRSPSALGFGCPGY
jgi:hypothetical protein